MADLTKPKPYTGKALKEKQPAASPELRFNAAGNAFEKVGDGRAESLNPYLPSPELVEVVRLAQVLRRPVVLKGEPGCGKTQLARAVAFEWYGKLDAGYRSKYFEWNIKSTSKASEGVYHFDHLERLRQANLARAAQGAAAPMTETREELEEKYLRLGPLAHALLTSRPGEPSILLIDEIDKADIDFPNDLLLELDEARSVIREAGFEKLVEAPEGARPVVFITSNNERELPQAFLRRCLFFHIDFPEKPDLLKILKAHLPDVFDLKSDLKEGLKTGADVVDKAIDEFIALRDRIENDPSVGRKPSTSELIDWVAALRFHLQFEPGFFETVADGKLHFFQTLLKSKNDFLRERDRAKTLPGPPKLTEQP